MEPKPKGRPKGSKNKPKEKSQVSVLQTQLKEAFDCQDGDAIRKIGMQLIKMGEYDEIDLSKKESEEDILSEDTPAEKPKFQRKPRKQEVEPIEDDEEGFVELGLPVKKIFKRNKFVDDRSVAPDGNRDARGNYIPPCPRREERREPAQRIKKRCQECEKSFMILPSELKRTVGEQGDGLTYFYICDGCLKRGARPSWR